jgi:YidC/Oxa1 family membrane protein insertase
VVRQESTWFLRLLLLSRFKTMLNTLYDFLGLLLSTFYKFTKSYGFSIILLTVFVRLVLFPLTAKQMRSMQGMSKLQPELKKLQAEHKDDRMKLQEEMTALYKREGVSPVGGCLPLVMQIPVFIGLFNTIRGLTNSGRLAWMQIEVPKPKYLDNGSEMYRSIVNSGGRLMSFGFDLAQSASGASGSLGKRAPFVGLVVAYVITAFLQQHLATRRNPQALTGPNAQVQQIMKIFPLFLGFFYYNMPAGLVLYFVASNLWTIAQQEVLAKTMPNPAPTTVDVTSSVAEESKNDSKNSLKNNSKNKGVLPKAPATPARPEKMGKPVSPAKQGNDTKAKPQLGSTPRPNGSTQAGSSSTERFEDKVKKAAANRSVGGVGTTTSGTKADKKRKGR